MNNFQWCKSSYCGGINNCVEVGQAPGVVAVRDTKNRDGGTLVVDRGTFAAFLAAVKSGRL
ncbi:DUF397 domain-containing protein [Actinoalloteichus spitiensis]|uniref:DUF397 domain-containing protein n=1 Tax=Actinoalloteichus spitiensis TaxID=252394 RepID=UPI00047525A0|nr:DUF397 domain-containing protein [Actinoalloteichus spitiensis]